MIMLYDICAKIEEWCRLLTCYLFFIYSIRFGVTRFES
nr:MAG TPA: hypothetical protein [Caudoviricetes sp.]